MSLHELIGLELRGAANEVLGHVVDVAFVPVIPQSSELPLHRVEGGLVALAVIAPGVPESPPQRLEVTSLARHPSGVGIIRAG